MRFLEMLICYVEKLKKYIVFNGYLCWFIKLNKSCLVSFIFFIREKDDRID